MPPALRMPGEAAGRVDLRAPRRVAQHAVHAAVGEGEGPGVAAPDRDRQRAGVLPGRPARGRIEVEAEQGGARRRVMGLDQQRARAAAWVQHPLSRA
ncbi:hypothetical protein GCM10010321_27990 [Streptomyces chartreusis]|nr:hypothetical protein GCM10010321_27990 [Streptomyces chartreusis]